MKLFIFKTNINTKYKVKSINDTFVLDTNILDVSVDLEDVDKVLRIETTDVIKEVEIVNKVERAGFSCVELAD
ncbi:hypothetical protein SAMN04489761_2864 [Tenacibaculum sp. MAR_2009_124]|uniref:hypothetical protein n=1 Tax=Tenacibaculum sp. MAR_2009_124 TaxID=1250059 RepID=UPI000897797E|nr:hypothetical protein [Tenacibaculum sp. MAR_2009_124]SEC39152.1 hypothetical protein SAMN04489761_2864 [Tenacibaculum sp. MAR_2009_124]